MMWLLAFTPCFYSVCLGLANLYTCFFVKEHLASYSLLLNAFTLGALAVWYFWVLIMDEDLTIQFTECFHGVSHDRPIILRYIFISYLAIAFYSVLSMRVPWPVTVRTLDVI